MNKAERYVIIMRDRGGEREREERERGGGGERERERESKLRNKGERNMIAGGREKERECILPLSGHLLRKWKRPAKRWLLKVC